MARTISEIQKQIQDAAVEYYTAAGVTIDVTKWSRRNIIRLWTFIFAAVLAVFEQLLDLFKTDIETKLNAGSPASAPWLQKKAFLFQYSATTPQTLVIVGYEAPQYATTRPDLQIITRAAVETTLSNNVKIKVAKNEPPEALTTPELDAFKTYIQDMGTAGINYTASSTAPDELHVNADVYYNGLFSAVIFTNVQTALNDFYKNLPFNGSLKISDLEAAIRTAPGVTDVVLLNVKARKTSTVFADGTYLIQDNEVLERIWKTRAGYIVEETTATKTLMDSLNLISE